jgi:hypothetical protein
MDKVQKHNSFNAFCLPNIVNVMHIQLLTEVILSSLENTATMCKQITILIFYKVLSW